MKNIEEIKNSFIKEIDENELIIKKHKKACTRTFSGEILNTKAFDIAKNMKNDGYKRGLASMFYEIFDKKSSSANTSGGACVLGQRP